MAHTFFGITRLLLAMAWLLLLICMFLPQVQVIYHDQIYGPLNGFFVAIAAFVLGLNFLLTFQYLFVSNSFEPIIILAIMLSDLLFIVSPLVLIKRRAGNLIGPGLYWLLNVMCLMLFILATPQILNAQVSINGLQLLPNLLLWLSAQTILTLSAGAQILDKYSLRHQDGAA